MSDKWGAHFAGMGSSATGSDAAACAVACAWSFVRAKNEYIAGITNRVSTSEKNRPPTATAKKMYAQKGTGQARHGNEAAPQFRGGGKAFGPVVRSHASDLPKKVRKLALRTALSAKAAEGKLIVVDAATLAEPKTAKLKGHFGKLGVSSVLVIAGAEVDANFAKAAANIAHVDVLPQQGANVYDILRRDTLVLTKDAVKHLEERLQ